MRFINDNQIDLTGRKISFIPNSSGGYNVKVSSGSMSSADGNSLGPVPIRSRKVNFTSGFSFAFYGIPYTSLYVDGCGSLGFKKAGFPSGDVVSALGGAPAIIPFEASCAQEVKTLQTPDRLTVTWKTPSGYRIDTQVNLLKNGTIEFLYGERKYSDLSLDYGLTGISPGKTDISNLELVNFSNVSTLRGTAKTAFFEEFRPILLMDRSAAIGQWQEFSDSFVF